MGDDEKIKQLEQRVADIQEEKIKLKNQLHDSEKDIEYLTDFKRRTRAMNEMSDAYVRMERLLDQTQGERLKQMESVGKFVQMLDLGSKKRVKAEISTQTDLRLVKHTQPDQLVFRSPPDSEILSQCYHPFSSLLGFVDNSTRTR